MKNKLIILILFIITITLTSGCSNYRELNNLAIITGVAIDKSDEKYELSFLIANSPKAQTSSKEGESTTTVFSGKGDTLIEAANLIDNKSPKQLYYGHINVVAISEEVAEEGFLKIADWLLRNPETRKQFYLIQAKDTEAKNILKIVEPLESFPSQSIASLIESNITAQSISSSIKYSPFIEKILDKGFDPMLPSISIEGKVKKGSTEKNTEKTEPETYLKLDDTAIFREDKLVGYINKKESQAVNLLTDNATEIRYEFKYNGNNLVFISNKVNNKTTVKNFNTINVKVQGNGFLGEIDGKVSLQKPSTVEKLEKALNKSVKKELEKTLEKIRTEYKSDIFGYGNKIYVKYPKKWDQIENQWNDKYLQQLNVNIDVDLTIESAGSLIRTIEEVRS